MLAMKTSNFVLWEYDCNTQLFTAFNEPLNNYNNDVKLSIINYLHVLHPDDINKLVPINEHIASPVVKELRSSRLIRMLAPRSVTSIGETMTPHPSLSEVIMWVQYYFEDK